MPQPADTLMTGRIVLSAVVAAVFACAMAAESEFPDEYSTDLSRVYWAYHQVLAQKDVCDAAVPATRAANSRAFTAWQALNNSLIEDVRRRVTVMIRRASTDEKDYARNLGKYEGAMLQERQDYRESLLKLPADELRGQCERMAEVLDGPQANLASIYVIELDAIRKRK